MAPLAPTDPRWRERRHVDRVVGMQLPFPASLRRSYWTPQVTGFTRWLARPLAPKKKGPAPSRTTPLHNYPLIGLCSYDCQAENDALNAPISGHTAGAAHTAGNSRL